ncbi:hypothetical protein J7L13_02970, partial [bacterium]|nr:hypothetical protein [bacterium]
MRFSQKIHYFLLPTIILIGCFFALKILAQGLNISYPTIPGATPPQNIQTPITNLLRYIYVFIISISGLIGTIMFIKAGIKYLTSTGDPVKMKEAKRSLLGSLLGILIIFSAYLILRTINPQLVQFSPILLPSAPNISLETITYQSTATAYFIEIPVGSLITSEFSLSSMYATIAPEECRIFPTDTACEYVKFQGALHGERLKRIHEVVSTTIPVIEQLATFTEELIEITGELKDKNKELVKYALECNCFTECERPCDFGIKDLLDVWDFVSIDVLDNPNANIEDILSSIQIDISDIGVNLLEFLANLIGDILSGGQCLGGCEANPCEDKCTGDPCPHRDEMNKLRHEIIPSYYQTENEEPYPSPIRCKEAEIKYLSEALYAFIDASRNLVKSKDYEDFSYWHSEKAKKWREILEKCKNGGEITQDEIDKIESLIDLMAEVENKGTYSPETDPPERDIETNLVHLYTIIKLLEKYKHQLNPYSQEYGSMIFIPRAKMEFIISSAQLEPIIPTNKLKLPILPPPSIGDPKYPIVGDFKTVVTGTSHKIRVADDGFAFYIPSPPSEAAPFLPPLYPPHSFEKNTNKFSLVNYAYAQQQEPFYSPPPSYCAKIVEIPVGKTIDKGLTLAIQVWDELNNVRSDALNIIDLLNLEVHTASTTIPSLSEKIIDLTCDENVDPDCDDGCKKCEEGCESGCFPLEVSGVGIHICYCIGLPCPMGGILLNWFQILTNFEIMKKSYDNNTPQ